MSYYSEIKNCANGSFFVSKDSVDCINLIIQQKENCDANTLEQYFEKVIESDKCEVELDEEGNMIGLQLEAPVSPEDEDLLFALNLLSVHASSCSELSLNLSIYHDDELFGSEKQLILFGGEEITLTDPEVDSFNVEIFRDERKIFISTENGTGVEYGYDEFKSEIEKPSLSEIVGKAAARYFRDYCEE